MSAAGRCISIAGRLVGPGRPPYVVAELSANHGGRFERAVQIIQAAAAAGAEAVKLQTYTPDGLTLDCPGEPFRLRETIWAGRTLYDLYREAQTPWEWQPKLKAAAEACGLQLFSSPFDAEAVDFLERMGVPAYKIASFELVDLPLLRRVARTGKPVILSTGMATLAEIDEAVGTLRGAGCGEMVLLKCTSAYPAAAEQMNLRAIGRLSEAFGVPAGLSDHTLRPTLPAVAVALGASMIEKHLTLSRADGGPDCQFSLEPHEFREMVEAVRMAHVALGSGRIGSDPGEEAGRALRRSLFVVRDVRAGETLTAENVRSIRPGDGLHPRYLDRVLGRRARTDLARGTPLAWDHVE